MTPFLVTEFGKPAISNLVKECFGSDFSDIHSKPQVDYIFRYLNDLHADSVLLEPEYVDKDYLEDHLMGRYLLLWLLGVPLPILFLIWIIGGLH